MLINLNDSPVNNYRMFLAIIPPTTVQHAIIVSNRKLESQLNNPYIQWHPPLKLHITIRFIANLPCLLLPKLQFNLENALMNFSKFKIKLGCPTLFPSSKNAVAIVYRASPFTNLLQLHQLVEKEISHLGIDKEKLSYRPHLTIAKVNHCNIKQLPNIDYQAIPEFWAKQLILFESDPKSNKMNYTPICHFSL